MTGIDWVGRRALVTGHTGFKGSWLSLWLHELGAEVHGLADGVPTTPSLFELARVDELVTTAWCDLADTIAVHEAMAAARPDVVFHLGAQSLVRQSYEDPVGTWRTNVLGTANVLDACRAESVAAVLVVSSDKCYDNPPGAGPHREPDPLGGADPYSASKAAVELLTGAWRASYPKERGPAVASARAGNVIGGGDWSADRIVPDAIRAHATDTSLLVRSPDAVRPWQDVLDCLNGYLLVASGLLAGDDVDEAWNFAPDGGDLRVRDLLDQLVVLLPGLRWQQDHGVHPPESHELRLDASKARARLGWEARTSVDESLRRLARWYLAAAAGEDMREVSRHQLADFLQPAGKPR